MTDKNEPIDNTMENSNKMIPFHLVTGFLGSGKTSFLKSFFDSFTTKHRIALIQNEFANAGIDSMELQTGKWQFDLLEVNNGSVFCVCLFSGFVEQLSDFIDTTQPDLILLEATGLADPIAVSQLIANESLRHKIYLSRIWTIVDAQNYTKVQQLSAVKNQIMIADEILINKIDLVDTETTKALIDQLKSINPIAKIKSTTYGKTNFDTDVFDKRLFDFEGNPSEGISGIYTQVFRTPYPVKRKNFDYLIKIINQDVLRLKGYVVLEDNKMYMIQSVFGETKLLEVNTISNATEIISISKYKIDFEFILRKLILL